MPPAGTAAFQRALRYALVAAVGVTPELMTRPTPCRGWDLRMLLIHATDSLAALAEGLDDGRVLLPDEASGGTGAAGALPAGPDARAAGPDARAAGPDARAARPHAWAAGPGAADPGAADPGVLFRRRARRLLAECARADLADGVITVGGCPMAATVLVTAGALEIAVHGWDIAQACGSPEPIPDALAAGLLRAAPLLIADADRRRLFAPPVPVAAAASPSDRLTAFLGRSAS
jgi:uncharacterized protein (TIGR03086 family)